MFVPYEGSHNSFKNLGDEAPVVVIPSVSVHTKIQEFSNLSSIEEILKAEVDLLICKV